MTAVDTEVLVRLLTADDPAQHAAARSLMETDRIWTSRTVLLETAWVLQSLYGFEESTVCTAFTKLPGLRTVQVEDPLTIASALALATQGVEFADALHLTGRPLQPSYPLIEPS